jgi:transcriptional regulator with XRE-family HTH domain
MTESTLLIATIKQQLKSQGMTYRDVAVALKISEPSVKRMLASGRLTINRLVELSHLLGYTLAELAKEAQAQQLRVSVLSDEQERAIVSNPKLLLVAVCALNHWTVEEIIETYVLGKVECVKYLLRLDKLRIVDLLPNNRIRLNVARDFDWLPNGPIRQYFQGKNMSDFLRSEFAQNFESMSFVHGMYTEAALAQLQTELRKLRQKFAELHEESVAAPLSKRHGAGLLLAMRGWEPKDFLALRRNSSGNQH